VRVAGDVRLPEALARGVPRGGGGRPCAAAL